ncbi:MAG: APC family permease [Candidatus Microbacterium phytovorans]|uniref:APC family permease n=1 Tax=Candidatus Microbacterium phytovorans TaxID=3121374 RepID=A0AAJ5W192_9MICO|nr:APC family permease [Microbacterium sp.]WEK13887.1 MAG: APC family permease [Microbacterium sp.]
MASASHRDARPALARALRLGDVIRVSISSVTPASSVVVILPAVLFALHWGAPIALLAAGLLCVPLAYCYSSLGRRFPSAGGEYAFARRLLGTGVARATWAVTIVGLVLAIAAMIQGAAGLLSGILGPGTETWSALGLCAAVALVAPQHVRLGARITSVMLFIEIVAVLGITAVGIIAFVNSEASVGSCLDVARSSLSTLDPGVVLAFVAVAYFALAGFGSAVILGEEDLDAGRLAARAVGWTLAFTFVLEFVPLLALLLGNWCGPVPPDAEGGLLTALSGFHASPALQAAVLGSAAIACLNAAIVIAMQGARIIFSAARDRVLPAAASRRLSRVHQSTRAPLTATMLLVSVAGAAALLLPGDRVITVASAALIVPPAVVAASRMAWSGGSSGVFRRWVVPGLALLALGLVAAFGVIAAPWPFAVPAVAWLVGLGYDRWHRHRSARKATPLDP